MDPKTRKIADANVESCALSPALAVGLGKFFQALEAAGDAAWFHPHPLTASHAVTVCSRQTKDVYLALKQGDDIVAYGMLRGWDEGYRIPSLGVAVHPDWRGLGLGRRMMEELHSAARGLGAERVRLKVYRSNVNAMALYRDLGYEFADSPDPELVGIKSLR
jgi:[ribosomal protein S18]-alanine N-acetyltransferase